jgi:hypothetical protein
MTDTGTMPGKGTQAHPLPFGARYIGEDNVRQGPRTPVRRRPIINASVWLSLSRHPRTCSGNQSPHSAGRDPQARPGDDVKASAPLDSLIVGRRLSRFRGWTLTKISTITSFLLNPRETHNDPVSSRACLSFHRCDNPFNRMQRLVVTDQHPGDHGAVGADDGHRYDAVPEVIFDLPGSSDHPAARQFASAWPGPPDVIEARRRLSLNGRITLKLANGRMWWKPAVGYLSSQCGCVDIIEVYLWVVCS